MAMRKFPLFVASALLFANAWPSLAGGLINPFSRYGQGLSADDVNLLKGAVIEALGQAKAGATATWSDEATGRAGQATVLKIYQKNGAPCGSVQHAFTKGGGTTYVLPFCLQKDGSWKIQF
jgi:surface antigen